VYNFLGFVVNIERVKSSVRSILFGPIAPSIDWLFIVRVFLGVLIISHGLLIFSSTKMEGLAGSFAGWGIPYPLWAAYLSKAAEFFGGVFLILGLFTRFVSLALVFNMGVACAMAFKFDIFGKGELPFVYLLLFAVFVVAGGGRASLDNVLRGS